VFVDSHCHLDYPGLVEAEADVVARAEAAGVGLIQTIATRLDRAPAVLELARRHASVVAAVGVHPHEAGGHGLDSAEPLLALANDAKVTALGESGLDYYYDKSPREAQERSFRAHIQGCRESGLPLVVHTRDADDDTARVLEDEMRRGPFTGVIHCYSSSRALAERAVALGLYLGIGGIATFKRSEDLRATIRDMPRERLLLETDAPYLAPPPHRGKRNEPAYIPLIAEVLARTLGEPLATVERLTTENFFRLFPKAVAATS